MHAAGGFRHFRRHVVFIVLGQYLEGFHRGGILEGALGDDALPLAEQVRQDTVIFDRHQMAAVVHQLEGHPEALGIPLHRTGHHQAPDAQTLPLFRLDLVRSFSFNQFAWGIEEIDILAEGIEHQAAHGRQSQGDGEDDGEAFFSSRVHRVFSICWAALRRASRACLLRNSPSRLRVFIRVEMTIPTRQSRVRPKESQT